MSGHEPLMKFIEATQLDHASPTLVTDAVYVMNVRETSVRCDTTSNVISISLPNVSEAIGKIYVVTLAVDGGNDLTITDQDESYDWEGDYTLNDALENKTFYSDGYKWHLIAYHVI